jgi:uncharacterized protein (TIRG00374 family)
VTDAAERPEETSPQEPSPTGEMAAVINEQEAHRLTWTSVAKRAIVVLIGGIGIYFVFPSLTAVFASWPRLTSLNPIWFAVAVAAEVGQFLCTFALQRLALRTHGWYAVVTAQLSSNAVSKIIPAGAAAGAAVEFRMLATAGIDLDVAVGGLTAFSLLNIGGLLALPIFALPAILFGSPVSNGLAHTAFIGIAGFALFAAFGLILLTTERPLAVFGRFVQRVRNRLMPKRPVMTGLDVRLVRQRDAIKRVLGRKWPQAVGLTSGRLFLDFLCLLCALRATGSHPRPSLVLLAYAVAGIIALIPITPGGLGLVEASLSGLLILAGVKGSDAFLATLAYRLASYWLPLLVGPFAYAAFWRRYGRPEDKAAVAPASS